MFTLEVKKAKIRILTSEILTAGMVNTFTCHFEFGPEWNGVDKTVVFKGSGKKVAGLLDNNNDCALPISVLEGIPNRPGEHVFVGIFGTKGNQLVIPTLWADLGKLNEGVNLRGTEADTEPPKSIYTEILDTATNALDIARQIRKQAQEGAFNGATFTPYIVGAELRWENDKGLENPNPVVIIPDQVDADKHFVYEQKSAESKWVIFHRLNKYPSVTVVDSGGTVVVGDISYISRDVCAIDFEFPFSGKAYLN